jgi:hypothetical protein
MAKWQRASCRNRDDDKLHDDEQRDLPERRGGVPVHHVPPHLQEARTHSPCTGVKLTAKYGAMSAVGVADVSCNAKMPYIEALPLGDHQAQPQR